MKFKCFVVLLLIPIMTLCQDNDAYVTWVKIANKEYIGFVNNYGFYTNGIHSNHSLAVGIGNGSEFSNVMPGLVNLYYYMEDSFIDEMTCNIDRVEYCLIYKKNRLVIRDESIGKSCYIRRKTFDKFNF